MYLGRSCWHTPQSWVPCVSPRKLRDISSSPQTAHWVLTNVFMFSMQFVQTGRREMFRSGSLQIRQSPGKKVANRLSMGIRNRSEIALCLWLASVELARVRSPMLLLKTTLLQTNRSLFLAGLLNGV